MRVIRVPKEPKLAHEEIFSDSISNMTCEYSFIKLFVDQRVYVSDETTIPTPLILIP